MNPSSSAAPESALIVHICPRSDWEQAQKAGEYRAASLAQEGFIHASRPGQVLGVANRFYRGHTDLLLLWIDPARLRVPLKIEAADSDTYPHLYGPLNLEAVVRVTPLPPADDGGYNRLLP